MKQIKVEITPREWAEKRMQLFIEYDNDAPTEVLDRVIKLCGFVLKEDTEEPKKPITMDDLKEGMKVMLRSDLVDGEMYGGCRWVKGMKKGCEITIKGIEKSCFCTLLSLSHFCPAPKKVKREAAHQPSRCLSLSNTWHLGRATSGTSSSWKTRGINLT